MNKNKQKPKILILDQADFIGGAELFISDLLHKINPEEFEIHLATSNNPDYLSLIPAQVFVHYFSPPSLNPKNPKSYLETLKAVKKLNAIIVSNKIDIVQSNTIRTHLLNSLSKAPKKIWFVHDFTFQKSVCRFLASRPNKILCCSNIVKEDIKNKIATKYHSKLKVIYNGVSLSNHDLTSKSHLKLKPKNKHPHIGLVGRIDWWKGQKELILAAKEVLKKEPKAKFLFYGSPNKHDKKTLNYFKEIKKLRTELNLQKSIIFKGHIDNILFEISRLDILVHASTQNEPFGRVIIEAMSTHTPVLASSMGGTKEIIKDKYNGLLVDPRNTEKLANSIVKLIQNPDISKKYAKNAYNTVENKFTLEHTTYQIQQSWYKLLS